MLDFIAMQMSRGNREKGYLTQNEARPVGHLTLLSKRLSAVDSTWVFLLLSFYIVKSWNMPLFKAGVHVKAVFTSLNTAFLPISRSRFKRRQIPMLITLSTIWQFCVNFWVIFRCFGKERFFLKG